MLHTSVRRGRDRMVVLIVLHLYSLLLPCFILQWVRRDRMVVLIVLQLYSLLLPCFILQSVMVVIVW